jgi:hypothetical protein
MDVLVPATGAGVGEPGAVFDTLVGVDVLGVLEDDPPSFASRLSLIWCVEAETM